MPPTKIMRCECGRIGFVCQVMANPRPENPYPCYTAYHIILWYREEVQKPRGELYENRE